MKKKILMLCAAVLSAVTLFGCAEITEDGGNITSFDCPELSGDELVMLPGETSEGWVSPNMRDLDLFSPDEVVFVSEDESVAQIELEEVRADIFLCYKVTAVSVGETYVYAMTTDGSVLTPKQKVTVDSGDEPETAEPLETVPPTPETVAVYETDAVYETAVHETAVPETEPETEIETESETFPETQPETEPAPETLPETETAPETEPIIETEPESTVPLPFELIPPPETEPEPEETDGGDMELTYETETEPIYEIPPQPEPELDVMSMNDVCEVRMGNTDTVNSDTVSNNPLSTYKHDTNGVTYVLNTNTKKIHYPSCDSVEKIKPKNYSTTDDYTSAIAQGYVPCKKCNP